MIEASPYPTDLRVQGPARELLRETVMKRKLLVIEFDYKRGFHLEVRERPDTDAQKETP